MKTIKAICKARYEVRLVETEAGKYRVCYQVNEKQTIGELISDYSIASKIFELKLIELEGH